MIFWGSKKNTGYHRAQKINVAMTTIGCSCFDKRFNLCDHLNQINKYTDLLIQFQLGLLAYIYMTKQ